MFNSPRLITFFTLVLSSLMAVSCNGPKGDANSEVAAKVGSREITIKHIDSVIKEQLNASPGATLSGGELVAARLTVIDNLIQEEALFQRGQKENLVPDENKVTQEIQKKKVEAHLTEDQYQTQLKDAGLSEAEYRERVARELAITALTDKEKARVNPPTEEEIRKAFDDNKTQFVAERGADISVIVTDPQSNGTPGDAVGEAAAEQKIKSVYDQLKRGSDFATVASQKSEHQSYIRGGNLGFASEAALKQTFPSFPQLPQRLMSMSVGDYTEPMKEPNSGAWLIFKLNNKRETAQNLGLDDVRQNIVDTLTQQRQQVLITALIMVAKSEASVKNLLAERLLANPQTIVQMRPSALLEQAGRAGQPQQPAARLENENQNKPASNANSAPPANANRPK
ncbi:MAG TPA: SurA N-terminal domain-containing protein [Blastocatellia bacterium]|nr:SurA N-terminal domain-containing protein [Blastocatellia bacterium]